jgi:hypothetical protein
MQHTQDDHYEAKAAQIEKLPTGKIDISGHVAEEQQQQKPPSQDSIADLHDQKNIPSGKIFIPVESFPQQHSDAEIGIHAANSGNKAKEIDPI